MMASKRMGPLSESASTTQEPTEKGTVPFSRGGRFIIVGAIGFAVQLTVLHALAGIGSVDYRLATVLAVEAAILHNFVWHERWTWRVAGDGGGRWVRLARFHTANALLSIVGNLLLTSLIVEWWGWPAVFANVTAVVLLSAANFLAADRWIFRAHTKREAAEGASPRPLPVARVVPVACVLWLAGAGSAWAAGPARETVAAWDRHVALTEQRIAREMADGPRFLSRDFGPDSPQVRRDALRDGVVQAERVSATTPDGVGIEVPDGMIHHWRGALFIPGAQLEGLMAAVADPEAHGNLHPDDVLEVRQLSRAPGGLRVFFKLERRSIVSVAYNTEHEVRYVRHSPTRASSRSVAVRIAEIANAGLASEHEVPADADRGFLWRMNSYWRYEAVPGGVIVELESLTLSRGLPWGIRTIARPILSRVARESLERTLTSLGRRAIRILEEDRRH